MGHRFTTPSASGAASPTLRRILLTGFATLLTAGLVVTGGTPSLAATGGLPSPTPEEALWYAVSYDMTQYADALRKEKTPGSRKANIYQAKYIEKILKKSAARAGVLETAGTICAKLEEATGLNGVLLATGHYMRTAPTDSMFPGHFPRTQSGLREEIDTLLRRSAGLHAGLLCEDRAADVETVVDTWKGAAWAGNVAKRIARDVSLTMGKNTSKGTVDEKAKTILAEALGKVCGEPVQTGDVIPCAVPGAPAGLVYQYGENERRVVGVHRNGVGGVRCSAFVTLEARVGKRPMVVYGNVSCYIPQQ